MPFSPTDRLCNAHHRTAPTVGGLTLTLPESLKVDAQIVEGDLLDQDVDAIVNAWNRNFIPWWLLLPQGVSGAIKRRGGIQPFKELRRHGMLPLGGAS
jgi:hypothetical protein